MQQYNISVLICFNMNWNELQNWIENEVHFVSTCQLYEHVWQNMFSKGKTKCDDFE